MQLGLDILKLPSINILPPSYLYLCTMFSYWHATQIVPAFDILKCRGHQPTLNLNLYFRVPGVGMSNIIKQLSPRFAIHTVFMQNFTYDGQFVGFDDTLYADNKSNFPLSYDRTLIDESSYPVKYNNFLPFPSAARCLGPHPDIFIHFYFQHVKP